MSSSNNPPDNPPTPASSQQPRLRRRRLLVLAGVVVLLLLVGVGAAVIGLYVTAERSLQRVEVDGIDSEPSPYVGDYELEVESVEDVLHVLLVGSDRREGLTAEEREELGTGDIGGQRTDTIMLMRMDPNSEDVSILSFPRDLLVTRCDGTRGKINAAYHIGETTGVGGPTCLVETIKDLSGLSVQHFVEVDFAGFLELVDMVNGVTVFLEEPIRDRKARLDLDAGCHRLTGAEALGFVRTRQDGADYGRIARQQRFVKELTREATSIGNVLNLPRVFQMVEAAASAVTTDQSLTLDKMRRIAFTLRDLKSDEIVARTVPGKLSMIDGIAFEALVEEEAERLFVAFAEGQLDEVGRSVAGGEDDASEAPRQDDDPPPADDGATDDADDESTDSEVADRPVPSGSDDASGAGDDASTGDDDASAGDDDASAEDDEFYVGAQTPPEHCR